MFAMFSEALLLAAAKIDQRNQKHAEHIVHGVAIAFAVFKGILGGAPLGMGSGVTEVFGPIQEMVTTNANNKYTKEHLIDRYKYVLKRVVTLAKAGEVVPGLDNSPATLVRARQAVLITEAERKERAERKAWGDRFEEYIKQATGVLE